MTQNMYRVGDFVYFDLSSSSPYSIRRIEELSKTSNGHVEAKTICYFRRRDISNSLITLADKHNIALEEEQEIEQESLNEKQRHQLKQRELFFSRQIETLPVTHIRGKCNVSLLNETESLVSYLNKDDSFFYTLVYEPNQKTLLADRGEIRVGQKYQAEVPKWNADDKPPEYDLSRRIETLVFRPNELTDAEIDQYLTIVKSIGTFGRALDNSSSIKQPNLHLTAAYSSRDVTIHKAMDVLHENDYDIGKALLSLTSNNVPTIFKDELEEWSPQEASLFDDSLEKYGKSFWDIRKEVLPWKKMKNLVEYYYMWKTTDRYVHQKRLKANEAESKLKQVYIPTLNNNNNNRMNGDLVGKNCESCNKSQSSAWFPYGAAHNNQRLCNSCNTYWKKFGGLRYPSKYNFEQEKSQQQNNSTSTTTNGQSSLNNNQSNNKELKELNNINNTNNTSESEFKCTECDKKFNRQERLDAHMIIHRSYRCNQPNCNEEFKMKIHLARHFQEKHPDAKRSVSPRPIMKIRSAFVIQTTDTVKLARRFLPDILRLKSFAKNPFKPINFNQIKQELQNKFPNNDLSAALEKLSKLVPVNRGSVNDVAHKLGIPKQETPEWLIPTPKDQIPQPERLAFPALEKDKNGNFIIPKSNNLNDKPKIDNEIELNSKKRSAEQCELDESNQPKKRLESQTPQIANLNRRATYVPMINKQPTPQELALRTNGSTVGSLNGKARISIKSVDGKNKLISWSDVPDDVLFVNTNATKKLRQQLQSSLIKRLRRRPTIKIEFPQNYDSSKL